MKQIDEIAREIKAELAGMYNYYYKAVEIYLDTDTDKLYCKFWGQGESYIEHPRYLIPLVKYEAMYGNWGDACGNEKTWRLTKKVIAADIKAMFAHVEQGDDYYPAVAIPEWLKAEVNSYIG